LLVGYFRQGLSAVRSLLPLGPPQPPIVQDGVRRDVIDLFMERLDVKRVEGTYVLAVSFDSEDRQRAADVANAVASTYLDQQLDARYSSIKRAARWLENRIAELRKTRSRPTTRCRSSSARTVSTATPAAS